MHRRRALAAICGLGGLSFVDPSFVNFGIGADAPSDPRQLAKPVQAGAVHVAVFSNFEGQSSDAAPVMRWFDACTAAHPSIRWTHMYSPAYLIRPAPRLVAAAAAYQSYLQKVQVEQKAEVGLHLHMFYDLIEKMGVVPRGYPYAGDQSAECNDQRRVQDDSHGGYDMLMTGYTLEEQAKLLDASVDAFVKNGFGRPTSFCAGYSAANPESQALLVQKGFSVSFSAQVIPPAHYGTCWERLLKWSGNITPLTIPYRVARNSILPPPHSDGEYLNLVEFPLNMGVDVHDLYWQKKRVTRIEMFDRHFRWARETGHDTAVAIGVHAEVVGGEHWGSGPVSEVVNDFLSHVARRANEGHPEVRYGTVSEIAQHFRDNRTIAGADVSSGD